MLGRARRFLCFEVNGLVLLALGFGGDKGRCAFVYFLF